MPEKQSNDLLLYAGLGTQLAIAIGLSLWFGLWLDKKCSFTTPIFVWLLPLIAIVGMLVSIIKETSKKQNK